ncbi:MAG: flagellar type III secretion system protein FlhB [Parasphingorhabdus sp.]|nr:flagellar type III secretion system protein FlhB [Parasphingorhabdus sp.]
MSEAAPGGGERTEAPTAKKRHDSAQKGDVLQSRELGGALVVAGGIACFGVAGSALVGAFMAMLSGALNIAPGDIAAFDPATRTVDSLSEIIAPLALLFGTTLVAAVAGPAVLGSLGFRASAFAPKLSKLNPASGLKRMFGPNGLIELGKAIAKLVLLGGMGLALLLSNLPEIFALGRQDLHLALGAFGNLLMTTLYLLTAGLAVIALIDVPAQAFQRTARLRMTLQEVKDEYKESEGAPEVKSAVRRRQQETLSRSARKAIEQATLVLVNPSHFAVVLRYRPGSDAAPLVLARGRDEIALAVRALAEEKNVPVLQYPELTRAVYFTSPVGSVIDERLYVAVATVLAFVFRLDAQLASEHDRPHVQLSPDLRFDSDGKTGAA